MNKKNIDKKVLVIGSELESLVVSNELANKGYNVTLIENNNYLGGRLNNTKLSSLSFNLIEKIKLIENNKNIKILKNTSLININGAIGNYKVFLLNDKIITLDVSIIVISSGADFKPVFDYTSSNFISFSQLNNFFNPDGITRTDILKIANKSFKKIGLYISPESSSRYNVNEFFQHALFLKNRYGSDVSIILPQVLVAGDELERIYKEIRDAGILIFKYNNKPKVNYMDLEQVSISFNDQIEGDIELNLDLLIYSEKLENSSYYNELLYKLKISSYNNINFQLLNSSRKGVYLCGLCRDDLLNEECIQDGIALAKEIDELIKTGKLEYENGVIDVDKQKCTLCLTCVRACPHAAIEMDRDILDERVIKIYDEACYHCGTCVGECPTKALTYNEEMVSTKGER